MGDRNMEHEIELERLASIVESSDDAIISKSLEGIIQSWNAGATKIFGYTADEMVGQPIIRLIPPELHDEETEILARLSRGERIEHFDTVRLAKNGRRIDISLTVSPLRNRKGEIVGASKVARDVTERKRAEALQQLLVDELNHRVKNTLAIVQSVASQSMAFARSPEQFLSTFSGRLQALSRAHDLLVRDRLQGISLRELIEAQLTPDTQSPGRFSIEGPDVTIRGMLVTHLALILHELATNARKYGALARPDGYLHITSAPKAGAPGILVLEWHETGVPDLSPPAESGFGTQLIEKTLKANGGLARIQYGHDGVRVSMEIVMEKESDMAAQAQPASPPQPAVSQGPVTDFKGLKILVVEDEPIVAMDLELKLEQLGCEIVGIASTVEEAEDVLSRTEPDIALLDANLHGQRVDRVADALASRSVPFAFATGYGREALPQAFPDAELLSKPFSDTRFLTVLARLASQAREGIPVAAATPSA